MAAGASSSDVGAARQGTPAKRGRFGASWPASGLGHRAHLRPKRLQARTRSVTVRRWRSRASLDWAASALARRRGRGCLLRQRKVGSHRARPRTPPPRPAFGTSLIGHSATQHVLRCTGGATMRQSAVAAAQGKQCDVGERWASLSAITESTQWIGGTTASNRSASARRQRLTGRTAS